METLNKVSLKSKIELLGREANASLSLNPAFRWIKFVLTDDQANLNGDRIPVEEFPNLIRTGINAPIKMAENTINPGHERAVPLGVITHLKIEENQVVGLAALWESEREDDVDMLKEMFANNEQVNFSWEIFYTTEEVISESIRNLKGVILRAATIVGIPAYDGRTRVLAFASTKNSEKGTMTLEEALARIAELEALVQEKETECKDLEDQMGQMNSSVTSLTETVTLLETEKEELTTFKQTIEAEASKNAKVYAIKSKFTEAGIQKTEEYFETNIEKLLSMTEDQLDFMVSEMTHFAVEASKVVNASVTIPNISTEKTKLSPKDLASELRTINTKR